MKKLMMTTAILAAVGTAPASAGLINWDFTSGGTLNNTDIGSVRSFVAGGFSLTAKGFTPGDIGTDMFSKVGGTDENGLGLTNDPSTNNEISFGHGFVQLNLDGLLGLLSGFQFSMESTTQNEGWAVYGSEDGSPFAMTLLASSSGTMDEALHNLPGGWDNYNFFYSGAGPGLCGTGCNANVLLASFDATATVPEAKTWTMMLAGFASLGLMGLRRRSRGRRLEAFGA